MGVGGKSQCSKVKADSQEGMRVFEKKTKINLLTIVYSFVKSEKKFIPLSSFENPTGEGFFKNPLSHQVFRGCS